MTAAPEVSPRAGAAPSGNVGGIEAARGGFAQAPGPEPLTSFRRVTLEEAVSRLRGAIRLVDGMQIDRVEAGPGYLASGAARNRDLVRILYRDAEGRRLQLDEQRFDLAPDSGGNELREEDALVGLRPGEPLTTAAPGGQVRVRWVDAGGFWLSLTAALSPDSLRRLVSRVR